MLNAFPSVESRRGREMKKEHVINTTEILIFILMFPFIKPTSLRVVAPLLDNLYDAGRILSIAVISLIVIFSKGHTLKVQRSFGILAMLEVWIAFSTLLNNTLRFPASVINGGVVLGVSLIVSYFAMVAPDKLIRALMVNFEWLIYANLFTQIVFPNGLYQIRTHPVYFLGLANGSIIFVLPAVTIAYLYYICLGKALRPLLLVVASVAVILMGWSATSVVGLLTAAVVLFVLNGRELRKRLKLIHIWSAAIFLDILISIFQIMDTIPILRHFIVDFLHKNTTLTGRTFVWKEALRNWRLSPLIGNGYNTMMIVREEEIVHAHNAYIQYLFISGCVGLFLFLFFNYSVIRNFDRNCGGSKSGKAIKIAFSVLFITYITEAYDFPLLFILYALAECIPAFVALEEEQNERVHPDCRQLIFDVTEELRNNTLRTLGIILLCMVLSLGVEKISTKTPYIASTTFCVNPSEGNYRTKYQKITAASKLGKAYADFLMSEAVYNKAADAISDSNAERSEVVIEAKTSGYSNVITLNVRASDQQSADDFLQSVMNTHTSIAEVVFGSVYITNFGDSRKSSIEDSADSVIYALAIGLFAGALCNILISVYLVVMRKTTDFGMIPYAY